MLYFLQCIIPCFTFYSASFRPHAMLMGFLPLRGSQKKPMLMRYPPLGGDPDAHLSMCLDDGMCPHLEVADKTPH